MKRIFLVLIFLISTIVWSAIGLFLLQRYIGVEFAFLEQEDGVVGISPQSMKGIVMINGHEAVDLGLSVKWATCNVGANSPEELGGYYAWGELKEKGNYSEDTYKYYNKDGTNIDIGANISGTSYDIAHVKWGAGWRMPTSEEMDELSDCHRIWTFVNDVGGLKFTGPNGNSIFLPATGYCKGFEKKSMSSGNYWVADMSSIYYNTNFENSSALFFDFSIIDISLDCRWLGYVIRPVIDIN